MSDPTSKQSTTSSLSAEVESISRAGQRLSIAMVIIAVVVVDLGIVAIADFGTRNQTVFRGLLDTLSGRGGPSFRMVVARFYATPNGVRIVSDGGTDMERIAATLSAFPPTEWELIAEAGMLSSSLHTNGYGLLTPARQITDYNCYVRGATMQPLTTVQMSGFREMFCDWLATDSDWASPWTTKYAAELKKGDHTATRLVWPLLVHDLVIVAAFSWSAWTILRTPIPTLTRARRIRRGHCPRCDYDLLAQFSDGCPECGWGRER